MWKHFGEEVSVEGIFSRLKKLKNQDNWKSFLTTTLTTRRITGIATYNIHAAGGYP